MTVTTAPLLRARTKLVAFINDPRERRVLLAQLGWLAAKGVSVGALLLTVPLTLDYLGPEQFGIWATLSSLTLIATAADLGIGNGLMTSIARAESHGDKQAERTDIANALAALTLLGVALSIGLLITAQRLDMSSAFGAREASNASVAHDAMFVFLLCILVALPTGVGQRIMAGRQLGLQNGLWAMAGTVGGIVGLLGGIWAKASLPILVGLYLGVPALVAAVGTAYVIARGGPERRPQLSEVSLRGMAAAIRTGLRYFLLFVVYAFTFTTDIVALTATLGAERVGVYAVTDRVFQSLAVVLSMLNTPLWPAYANAHARGDHVWLKRRFLRSVATTLTVCAALSAPLLLLRVPVFSAWVGPSMVPPLLLAFMIAARRCMEALYSAVTMLLNVLDAWRFQLATGFAMAICVGLARPWMIARYGIQGAPLAVILAMLLCFLLPVVLLWRQLVQISILPAK